MKSIHSENGVVARIDNTSVLRADVERRSNFISRNAIEEMQDLLFDPDASKNIFTILLKYISKITGSDYNSCYVSGENAEFPILANARLKAICPEGTREFINSKVLASWVGQTSLLNFPAYYNTPIPKGTQLLLLEGISVCSVMILPIVLNQELRAVCVLASKKKRFNASMLSSLKPLLDAIKCTLQSAERVRGNFSGLDQHIADNRYLSSLISSSPLGILVVDASSMIVQSNPAAQDIFAPESVDIKNHEQLSLAGANIHEFFPNYDTFFKWSNQLDQRGEHGDTHAPRLWEQHQACRRDGTYRLVNLTIFKYTNGEHRFTTLQIQDVTDAHKKSEDYKRASQQLNALTQLAPVGIIHITSDWNCIFANEKWTEFSGLSSAQSAKRNWINAIHPQDVGLLLLALRNNLQEGIDHNQEVRLISPAGATKWVDFSMRVMFDENGELEGFLGTCNDVTERYINQEKMRHIAEYDALTGLASRMLFQDRLQHAFFDSERDHSVVSIFFLDLDGFKDVNDSLGHDVGDILLQRVADRLINILRRNDTVARFGGDEFVIMLGRDEHIAEVMVVANKVIKCLAEPYIIDGHEILVTTSLGIAQGSTENSSPETLLKNADLALYNAKSEGKNKFQLFNLELEQSSVSRINLLSELRLGLQKQRFLLHYQPICDCDTDSIIGFEALLRFCDNNNVIIPPDQFISLLEESGLIIDVGCWVIEEVCRQLSMWQLEPSFPNNTYIAFNVSAKQMSNDNLVKHIQAMTEQYKIAPSNLVMEVTESVIISNPAKGKMLLDKIKDIGLRLALDDFGTGYSSLSYLQKFPFNIIKIDKSFVDNLQENNNEQKIVKAIIALASSLKLLVVAEGVETDFVKQAVAGLGSAMYQGYLISKPVPPDEVIALIGLGTRTANH